MTICFISAGCAISGERRVTSAAEISAAAKNARPGDVIVMSDGSWKDAHISFEAHGTAEHPVTLRAETPGKVTLDGDSYVAIDGEHVVVSGLFFTDSNSTKDAVQIAGSENRLTDSAIIAPHRGGKWIHFTGGHHNRMDHCYLEGHAPQDVRLQVEVDEDHPNEHVIDHNHFGPRPPLKRNGGETIRVGYSGQSMRTSRTLVENNLFENCDGEIEIISNKSCENIYRYNTFRDSAGCLTLRHGNRCIVDSNFFFGNGPGGKKTGGIRVIGEDHTIINNYFEGTNGLSGGVITLTSGIPNSPLKGYWQIKKALVAFNTFVNNVGPCILLSGGYKEKTRDQLPRDVTIANNLMLSLRPTTQPLVVGREGANFRWVGNLANTGVEIGSGTASSGIKLTDVRISRSDDGLWRPAAGSPARAAAQGEFSNVNADIDGQPRPSQKADVGCDQLSDAPILHKPLTAADVGPSWPCIPASHVVDTSK